MLTLSFLKFLVCVKKSVGKNADSFASDCIIVVLVLVIISHASQSKRDFYCLVNVREIFFKQRLRYIHAQSKRNRFKLVHDLLNICHPYNNSVLIIQQLTCSLVL